MVGYPSEEEGKEKGSEQREEVKTERRNQNREKRQRGGRIGFRLIGENEGKEESTVDVNERRSSSSSQRRWYTYEGIFVQFRNYYILYYQLKNYTENGAKV
jgi:hypothetical protein